MKTIITYITDDGKEFTNQFKAKKHECELTSHVWNFYNDNMGLQKEEDENSKVAFCKNCGTQRMLK